jgi:hypothetical protein
MPFETARNAGRFLVAAQQNRLKISSITLTLAGNLATGFKLLELSTKTVDNSVN